MGWRRTEAAFNWTTSRRRRDIRGTARSQDGEESTRQGRVSTNVALTLHRIISCRARPTGLIKLIIVCAWVRATESFRTAANALRRRTRKIRDYCMDGRLARDVHHREMRLRISDQSC